MIVRKLTTRDDQKYYDEEAKILKAHESGKLPKSMYTWNPKKNQYEIKAKKVFKRIAR